jgi:hypothetical protein
MVCLGQKPREQAAKHRAQGEVDILSTFAIVSWIINSGRQDEAPDSRCKNSGKADLGSCLQNFSA